MKKIIVMGLMLSSLDISYAQDDSTKTITFSGFIEAYHTYDFSEPESNNRPGFIYNHSRHNELNLNLAFLKGAYNDGNVRANLALAIGTYMNANYAAEPGVLKNIFEATAGVRLSQKKDLWVDAGLFGSHIGFESAISKDCWTLTRSISAENTPYFETGAKITYVPDNGKWLFSGLVLNGWQQITRPEGSNRLSLGTQVQYKPSASITLNSSTFIGNRPVAPGSAPLTLPLSNLNRYFHNFYGIFQLSEAWGLIAGFDFGLQQRGLDSDEYDNWQSANIILRYHPAEKWWIAGRYENYTDERGIVIATGTPNGFNVNNVSLNLDYAPSKKGLVRIEGRYFMSQDKIFMDKSRIPTDKQFIVVSSLAISF
jgi:hypothetical protein